MAGSTTRTGRRSFWLGFAACLIVTNAALYLGPSAFPVAAIRPGAAAFAAGMAIMVAGVVLRGWSFHALGQYFTAVIKVSPDQPVITSGPYRLLRHPSYAGGLLAEIGIAVTSANWVSVAVYVAARQIPLLRLAPQAPDPAHLVTTRRLPRQPLPKDSDHVREN